MSGRTWMSDRDDPASKGDHARERIEEFLLKRMPQSDTRPAPDHEDSADEMPAGDRTERT
jgi:hypothetical protein